MAVLGLVDPAGLPIKSGLFRVVRRSFVYTDGSSISSGKPELGNPPGHAPLHFFFLKYPSSTYPDPIPLSGAERSTV